MVAADGSLGVAHLLVEHAGGLELEPDALARVAGDLGAGVESLHLVRPQPLELVEPRHRLERLAVPGLGLEHGFVGVERGEPVVELALGDVGDLEVELAPLLRPLGELDLARVHLHQLGEGTLAAIKPLERVERAAVAVVEVEDLAPAAAPPAAWPPARAAPCAPPARWRARRGALAPAPAPRGCRRRRSGARGRARPRRNRRAPPPPCASSPPLRRRRRDGSRESRPRARTPARAAHHRRIFPPRSRAAARARPRRPARRRAR